MLFLLLQAGSEKFAVDVGSIIEVIPFVTLKTFPQAPPEIAGVMNFRGRITPILDLSVLLRRAPSRPIMSTRIIMVTCSVPGSSADHHETHVIGLLAERVIETFRCEPADLQPSNLNLTTAPFLGEIIPKDNELIQRLFVKHLVPAGLLESLGSVAAEPE